MAIEDKIYDIVYENIFDEINMANIEDFDIDNIEDADKDDIEIIYDNINDALSYINSYNNNEYFPVNNYVRMINRILTEEDINELKLKSKENNFNSYKDYLIYLVNKNIDEVMSSFFDELYDKLDIIDEYID